MWLEIDGVEINGQPPELRGQTCEAFLCEQFWSNGELVDIANVVHLLFEGQWHRLTIDSGIVFWARRDEAPESWAIPEEGASFPLFDLGAEAGVLGAKLTTYRMEPTPGGSRVTFVFENAREVILDNHADRTSYSGPQNPHNKVGCQEATSDFTKAYVARHRAAARRSSRA